MSRQIPSFDLYRELEIDPEASTGTIEAAWRSLAKRHHPDVAGDRNEALAKTKRLNEAHDWLTDASLRAAYDLSRRSPGRERGTKSGEFEGATARPGEKHRAKGRPSLRDRVAVWLDEQRGTAGDVDSRFTLVDDGNSDFVSEILHWTDDEFVVTIPRGVNGKSLDATSERRLRSWGWEPLADFELGASSVDDDLCRWWWDVATPEELLGAIRQAAEVYGVTTLRVDD